MNEHVAETLSSFSPVPVWSNPWIEQLPPTIAKGVVTSWTEPNMQEFMPSGTIKELRATRVQNKC